MLSMLIVHGSAITCQLMPAPEQPRNASEGCSACTVSFSWQQGQSPCAVAASSLSAGACSSAYRCKATVITLSPCIPCLLLLQKSKKKAKPLPSLADLAGTLEDVLAGKQASTEKQQQQQHTFGQSVGTLKARTLIM